MFAVPGIIGLQAEPMAEPTRGLEPRTARLQEAFIACMARLALKVLNSAMTVDALRGSRRHEFDDTADDRLSAVDSLGLAEIGFAGVNPAIVRERFGHASIASTLRM